MKMPWEDDIDWGNTATTIVKGEPMKYWKDRLHLIACGGCQPKPIGKCIECKYYEDLDNEVGTCVYKNSLPNAEDNACVHFERRADDNTIKANK